MLPAAVIRSLPLPTAALYARRAKEEQAVFDPGADRPSAKPAIR